MELLAVRLWHGHGLPQSIPSGLWACAHRYQAYSCDILFRYLKLEQGLTLKHIMSETTSLCESFDAQAGTYDS